MNEAQGLAGLASLLADRSRAAMLLRLMDGRAYTAGELARAAGIAPATASHHLERLERANLLARLRQGRHFHFRIRDAEVAGFIEQALAMHAGLRVKEVPSRCPANLRHARLCYDHLAGECGVRLLSGGLTSAVFMHDGERVVLGEKASALFDELGIAPEPLEGRYCLDWSERRFHLAGPLAARLTDAMIEARWFLRGGQRELVLTEKGRRGMARWAGREGSRKVNFSS